MITISVGDIFIDFDLSFLQETTREFIAKNIKEHMRIVKKDQGNKRIKIIYKEINEKIEDLERKAKICKGYPAKMLNGEFELVLYKEDKYYEYLIDVEKKELTILFEKKVIEQPLPFFSITLQNLDCVILNLFLIEYNCLIVHSSAFVYEDKAYLFLGHSGAGKSTIYNLVKKNIKNSTSLSQDRNIIFLRNNEVYLAKFWMGLTPRQEGKFYNKIGKLEKAFFIKKGNNNTKEKITAGISKLKLSNLFFRFSDDEQFLAKATNLIFNFAKFFNNFYILEFTKDKEFINFIKLEIENRI